MASRYPLCSSQGSEARRVRLRLLLYRPCQPAAVDLVNADGTGFRTLTEVLKALVLDTVRPKDAVRWVRQAD